MSAALDSTAPLMGVDATVDPFARVLALGGPSGRRLWVSVGVSLSLYVGGLSAFAKAYGDGPQQSQLVGPTELEIPIEPPPPPPEPEPPPPEPEPEPEEPPPKAAPAPAPQAPPAAAQAGQVLTADPDPDAPVDLTGDGFVQGTADTFAGGVTASSGTSKTAVYDPRAVASAPVVTGAKPGPPAGPDRSRRANTLSGSWDHCGFPPEADIEQVNYARVTVAVVVGADGRATGASVAKDPGYGFGALARRCALRERYQPALDRAGQPVTQTLTFTINFRR